MIGEFIFTPVPIFLVRFSQTTTNTDHHQHRPPPTQTLLEVQEVFFKELKRKKTLLFLNACQQECLGQVRRALVVIMKTYVTHENFSQGKRLIVEPHFTSYQ